MINLNKNEDVKEAYTGYVNRFLDGMSESNNFINWLRTPKGKRFVELIQRDIKKKSIICYRGINLYHRQPGCFAGTDTAMPSSSPLLNAKEGSTITLTKSVKYPLQHWTEDRQIAYEFSYEHAEHEQNSIILKATIPIDMIIYHYKYIDLPDLSEKFKREKEISVWHKKPIHNAKVVMNKRMDND